MVTENVTVLSPAACDPGKADMRKQGKRPAGVAGPGDRGRRGAGRGGGGRAAAVLARIAPPGCGGSAACRSGRYAHTVGAFVDNI